LLPLGLAAEGDRSCSGRDGVLDTDESLKPFHVLKPFKLLPLGLAAEGGLVAHRRVGEGGPAIAAVLDVTGR